MVICNKDIMNEYFNSIKQPSKKIEDTKTNSIIRYNKHELLCMRSNDNVQKSEHKCKFINYAMNNNRELFIYKFKNHYIFTLDTFTNNFPKHIKFYCDYCYGVIYKKTILLSYSSSNNSFGLVHKKCIDKLKKI